MYASGRDVQWPSGAAVEVDLPDRAGRLAELRRRLAATGTSPQQAPAASVAGSGILPVPEPLADVLPRRGLPRGGVVSLGGGAATSLLLALLAAPPRAWLAAVGLPDLGLLAAAELGVDLGRVALVPDPGPDVLQVISVLADGVDMIAVAAPAGPLGPPARLRVITARLQQYGAVLLVMGVWPGADLVLTARSAGWTGLGLGHGRLRDRTLLVRVRGRGAATRDTEVAMVLAADRHGVTAQAAGLVGVGGAVGDVAVAG